MLLAHYVRQQLCSCCIENVWIQTERRLAIVDMNVRQ